MRTARDNDLADRHSAAADAKAALLRAYRAKMDAAGPTRLARQAELVALAAARDERRAERDRMKSEAREQERIQAEAAAYQEAANVAARAKINAQEKADSLIVRVIKDEAARKADRDQRYANRKTRQR